MKAKIIALIFSAVLCLSLLLPPILPLQQVNAAGTLSVTSAYWQIGSSTVTTAHVGDSVQAKAVITAQGGSVSGTWKIEVVKDISWSSDQIMAQASGSVSLESGASQTISVSWSPDEASGQNSVDGYFIVVYYNSTKIYTMSSRLSVTTATAPTPTRTTTPTPRPTATATQAAGTAAISNAYWQIGSATVTTARVGDTVVAKAILTAQGGSISGTWKLQIIKDISLASDEIVAEDSGTISLAAGQSQTLSLSWSPDTASGDDGVDGYFIVVYFNGAKKYTMPSRLTVTEGSVEVSAYFQIGGSTVTTAQVGDTVLATSGITAQGGSISGTWKLQVVKDISLASDEIVAEDSGSLSLSDGESKTISLSWSPDEASGQNSVDGYFIVVYINSDKYTMQSRLTVTGGTAEVSAYWQIGSSTVTTAQVGDTVLAKSGITAQGGSISGTWKLQVVKDISLASDEIVAEDSGSINLSAGQSQTLSLSWSPDTASGDDGVDGYFIVVYINDDKWTMESRLTVTGGETAVSAYFQIGGSTVTTAQVGDTVLAKSGITAQGGSISGTWKLQVVKDISLASDETVAEDSGSISLSAGQSQTLSLSWSPDQASGADGVDGYFIVVYINDDKWTMESRLTVTQGQAPSHTPTPTLTPNNQWRENVRSGDILFDPTFLGGLGHAGICYGTDYVIEATFNGVKKNRIEQWDNRHGAYVLRVDCSDQVASAAASLALTQVGKDYDFFYIQKSSDMQSSYWYCSELAWAVYMNQGINLEYTPDDLAVSPWEIYASSYEGKTQVIGHFGMDVVAPGDTWLGYVKVGGYISLSWLATCPVDLEVTDPDNLTISRSSSDISNAVYMIDDINDDGSPDTWVGLSEGKTGTYNTKVIPQAEAQLTDTYTLKNYQSAGMTTMAENVSIADIPSEPYSVEYHADTSGLGAGAWAGIAIGIVIALVIGGYFLLGMIFGWKTEDTGKK